jgi:hypothetical protein
MVMQKSCFSFSMVLPVFCILFLSTIAPFAKAQGVSYTVNQEWVKIWVNTDRSIDVQYNITFTYLSGQPQGIFRVGMPKGGFHIQYVQDPSGYALQYQDVSQGSYYGIDVYLKSPITIDSPYTFIVYAVVPEMVVADETNPGNVGMLFYPTTFSTASGSITDLRVEIVLPQGVQNNEVKSPTDTPFYNVFTEGNNTAVYWERQAWPPSQTFTPGVSFPEKYVSPAPSGPPTLVYLSIAAFVLIVAGAIVAFAKFGKAAYLKPRISVEALGAARGLTAVEAGVVLEQKPVHILTMILYGLLLKRMVAVTETSPLIRLKKLGGPEGETHEPKQDPTAGKWNYPAQETPTTGSAQPTAAPLPPRYYEKDYLKAINPDGTLDEMALAHTYVALTDAVNEKLRGHSREDTVNYYKSVVDQAWTQVTQAGTPELKGDALDKNLEWLLADEKFGDRLKTAFPPGIIIYPMPGWWWYWGGPNLPSGQQRPSTTASPTAPTQAKPLPVQDFANNVVRGLETASNNIVKNVQDFANRLIPLQAPQNERSVKGRSSCVCACHACACACACVSCACACAGGGGR